MSVTIVGHEMGNMPVEVLNLGEKRYVESSFTNGKAHLLRNVRDEIIYHQRGNNDSSRLQLFGTIEYGQHTLGETFI